MKDVNRKEKFLPLIQSSCLGIAKEIDAVCRNNDIQYSLCGGSVIGAYLFQGFIPWDDDIDLMMTRRNYDKFLAVFPKCRTKRYRLLNYRTEGKATVPTLFSRVEDLETEITEKIAGKIRKGHVFVDITVMDNVAAKWAHWVDYFYGSYVYAKLYQHNGMVPGTGWKRKIFHLFAGKASEKDLLKTYEAYEDYCKKNRDKKTKYCAELMSAAYSGLLYERKIFDNYMDISFEDTQFMVISKYKDYLRMRYGNREFTREVPQNQQFNSHIIDFKIISEI